MNRVCELLVLRYQILIAIISVKPETRNPMHSTLNPEACTMKYKIHRSLRGWLLNLARPMCIINDDSALDSSRTPWTKPGVSNTPRGVSYTPRSSATKTSWYNLFLKAGHYYIYRFRPPWRSSASRSVFSFLIVFAY